MMKCGKLLALGLGLSVALGAIAPVLADKVSELEYDEPQLLFGSGFESGTLVDGDDWNYSGNKPEITTEKVRSGKYAVKSYLHRYDSHTSYRTELRARAPVPVKGKDTWYGFSIYLPSTYKPDWIDDFLVQWHAIPDPGEKHGNPPLGLVVKNGKWELRSTWNAIQPTVKSRQRSTGFHLGPHDTNKWTDWVFRIRWSYGNDGILQVWKNGKQVVNRIGPNCYNDKKMPYFKMGIYKSQWRTKFSDVLERTVYHDEVRMAGHGASYSTVAPGLKR
jgi:hypothetical protein